MGRAVGIGVRRPADLGLLKKGGGEPERDRGPELMDQLPHAAVRIAVFVSDVVLWEADRRRSLATPRIDGGRSRNRHPRRIVGKRRSSMAALRV